MGVVENSEMHLGSELQLVHLNYPKKEKKIRTYLSIKLATPHPGGISSHRWCLVVLAICLHW